MYVYAFAFISFFFLILPVGEILQNIIASIHPTSSGIAELNAQTLTNWLNSKKNKQGSIRNKIMEIIFQSDEVEK